MLLDLLGLTLAITSLVVTGVFWRVLFQSRAVGAVTVVIWILILAGRNIGALFVIPLIGWTAFLHREWILSWFYSLTPHPAARIADQALKSGGTLNVDAFANAVREAMGENEYERAARAKQLEEMAGEWRDHELRLREGEAQVMEADRQELAKSNELVRAQVEALEAAIAHERAAARFEELQRARQSNGQ